MIAGIGIDLVDVDRFRRTLDRWDDDFRARIFTRGELEYARGAVATVAAQRLAARFAAKEAWIKASGLAIAWTEIEVVHEGRAPRLLLHGKTQAEARRRGIEAIHLTLTHTDSTAAAVVVVERIDAKEPVRKTSTGRTTSRSRKGKAPRARRHHPQRASFARVTA